MIIAMIGTCRVDIAKELVRYIGHLAEHGQITGPLNLQTVSPRLA